MKLFNIVRVLDRHVNKLFWASALVIAGIEVTGPKFSRLTPYIYVAYTLPVAVAVTWPCVVWLKRKRPHLIRDRGRILSEEAVWEELSTADRSILLLINVIGAAFVAAFGALLPLTTIVFVARGLRLLHAIG
ncbi:hypothetical protein [Caenimonas aquaedulcis]|uniref:Uncharacterized protein n=1 Tax=Caenimonas aquaedulcis TaxID=2793270 RepID=A0A931H509_9BURK|nr:hypothetical protein [Caenimonas aquaedulcis]MBG9388545.1 hypothetical protein [Caenimonas aquaedulcis]